MVELRERRIVIDGEPRLIFCGEIHYYRLQRSEWEDRVRKLVECGCNACASYIPWIYHEEQEGEFDLHGRRRPESDVGAFIDLCARHGLWFVARPGPFIMAEMKNEGIPYWVYTKHPDAVPLTWDGEKARSKTLDYLNGGYLESCRAWYAQIMPILASRLQPRGGPIIGVQLDNEAGMLSWVNNQPDLTDDLLCDFSAWLGRRYSAQELGARYPFDVFDPAPRAKAIRTPQPSWHTALHRDLGDYLRDRLARYFATLRGFAEEYGVRGVPFIVNIHGTGGGRAATFPIGISQLYQAYTQAPGYLSGSDHYLGELTRENAADLYYLNAFMAAVHRPEQPLTSMEFEVGSGDYGEVGVQQSGASGAFKVRMSVAQNNRLLNYYLFAGGRNPMLLQPVGDGNDRVAFTGERHGFAAPLNPEGERNATFPALREVTRTLTAVGPKLADMDEEWDDLALGFLPDTYKTDFHRPGPMRELVEALEYPRSGLETLTRALMLGCWRYTAVDLQQRDPSTKVVALSSSRHMDPHVQERLARHVERGGGVLALGELPTSDMEGRPCTLLLDKLGVRALDYPQAGAYYHLSVQGEAWAADQPEVRVWRAQTFDAGRAMPWMRVVDSRAVCGFEAELGRGRFVALCCNYPLHLPLYQEALARLGVGPALAHDHRWNGVFLSTQRNAGGERFLTVLNLDQEPKSLRVTERGRPLFDGRRLTLGPRDGRLLPLDMRLGRFQIVWSTAELVEVGAEELVFRGSAGAEAALIEGSGFATTGATATRQGDRTLVQSLPGAATFRVSLGG